MVSFTLSTAKKEKTRHKVIFTKILKLNPDPHKKQLDPDPQEMNADPQPCLLV